MADTINDDNFASIKHQAASLASGKINAGLLGFVVMAVYRLSDNRQKQIILDALDTLAQDTRAEVIGPIKMSFDVSAKQLEELNVIIDEVVRHSLTDLKEEMTK